MSSVASNGSGEHANTNMLLTREGAPPPPPDDAPPEARDAYWERWVHKGDLMPQLTIRAVLMGGAIGMLMSISNLYTVLKVGWLFGVAITACVMSYVVWNLVRACSFGRISQMSILENACMASTASAAGYSTGSTIGTMFGAMLLIKDTSADGRMTTMEITPWWIVVIFTFFTAALGVFLAIPMKRQMINQERLPFPSGIAAAATLRSLYSQGRKAVRQAYALVSALGAGMLIGVANQGHGTYANAVGEGKPVPFVFDFVDRWLFGWIPELMPGHGVSQLATDGRLVNAINPDGSHDPAKGKLLQAFGFEPSSLLIAAGMLIGLRPCLSMLGGSLLLYFVVGPWLVAQDFANTGVEGYLASIKTNSRGTMFRFTDWSLWAGTSLMVTSSVAALALQWKTIVRSFRVFRSGSGDRPASVEVPAG